MKFCGRCSIALMIVLAVLLSLCNITLTFASSRSGAADEIAVMSSINHLLFAGHKKPTGPVCNDITCDDGNSCTVDSCNAGVCAHTPVGECISSTEWAFDIKRNLKTYSAYGTAIVYIDPSAASPGSGTSPDTPLASWSQITTFTSNTAYVQRRGTVDEVTSMSIAEDNVLLGAYGEGARPILNDISSLQHFISFSGKNIIIRDLEIISTTLSSAGAGNPRAISISGEGATIYNNKIHGASREKAYSFCLAGNGDGTKILHNEIYNCRLEALFGGGPFLEFGYNTVYEVALQALDDPNAEYNGADIIQFYGASSCEGTWIHHNSMDGSLINRKFAFINTDCPGDNASLLYEKNHVKMANGRPALHIKGKAIIRDNYFEHLNGQSDLEDVGGMVWSYLTSLEFYNNIVKNYDCVIGSSANRQIVNNLIINSEPHGWVFADKNYSSSRYINNILNSPADKLWWNYGTLLATHNLIVYPDITDDNREGDNPVHGDPLFVNPSGGDYHLQATSPAVRSGYDQAYSFLTPLSIDGGTFRDKDGYPIPSSEVSIGPYQH